MDAQQFLAEFGHIANARGGIDQLRQVIYQLAITGALTQQSNEREDAHALLAEVQAIRRKLIAAKAYKRLVELESESIRIPTKIKIPSNWCWTRLLDVGEINPRNVADADAPAAFLPMSGVPQVHRGRIAAEIAKWNAIQKGYTHFAEGDVVIAKITPCFENGKAAAITNLPNAVTIGAGTTELHVFRPIHPGILPDYVYLVLRSPHFAIEGRKNMTGTAGQKRLPTDYFATRAFPLPPPEEQSRIVARVDDLMALCDRLEAQQTDGRTLQTQLRGAALEAVASASTPQELKTSWTRVAANFGQLLPTSEDVDQFRDVILYLALRGALVRSVAVGVAEQATEAAPSLPAGWQWQTLGDLSDYITSGSRGWNRYLSSSGDAFIRSQDIKKDALIFEKPVFVTLPEKAEGTRTLVRKNDLLLTITGANVGRCALAPEMSYKAYVSQHVALIRLQRPELAEFIHFWMVNLFGGRRFLAKYIYGDKPGLNLTQVASVPVPIPPEEVRGEVQRSLHQHWETCATLAGQIKTARLLAAALATAAVNSLSGINSEQQEDEPVKAPQTELIAPLRLGNAPGVKDQAPLATLLARHHGEMSARDLWQRFSGEIDAFYAQLKTEVANGWIAEPATAEMREMFPDREVA